MKPEFEGLELDLEVAIEELEQKIAPSDTVFPFMRIINPDGGGSTGGNDGMGPAAALPLLDRWPASTSSWRLASSPMALVTRPYRLPP